MFEPLPIDTSTPQKPPTQICVSLFGPWNRTRIGARSVHAGVHRLQNRLPPDRAHDARVAALHQRTGHHEVHLHRLLAVHLQEADRQSAHQPPGRLCAAGQRLPLPHAAVGQHPVPGVHAQVCGVHVRPGARLSGQSGHQQHGHRRGADDALVQVPHSGESQLEGGRGLSRCRMGFERRWSVITGQPVEAVTAGDVSHMMNIIRPFR